MIEDRPEKITFEQRRISPTRYQSVPRRQGDKRLFQRLTPKQETALDLIALGRQYELVGLPAASMRYDDAPKGQRGDLSVKQLHVLFDYREWRGNVYRTMPAVHYAVMNYINGMNLMHIERSLKITHGKAPEYISIGLNRYCTMKGWGDQSQKQYRRVRITGCAATLERFHASYFDELGRPVADLLVDNETDA